jgi:hypothetical protein
MFRHLCVDVLAGLGGSLAYAVKVFDPGPAGPVAVGAAALCGYLVVVAVGLVKGCLVVRPIPPVHNEPANLAQTQYSIDALREAELENMQARIAEVTKRNDQSASRLNALRQAAIASPLVFVVAAITNWHLQPPVQRAPQRLVCQVGPAASASASDRVSVVCDLSQSSPPAAIGCRADRFPRDLEGAAVRAVQPAPLVPAQVVAAPVRCRHSK